MLEFYNHLESVLGFGNLWMTRRDRHWIFRWEFKDYHLDYEVDVHQLEAIVQDSDSKGLAMKVGSEMREMARAKG